MLTILKGQLTLCNINSMHGAWVLSSGGSSVLETKTKKQWVCFLRAISLGIDK